MGRSITPKYFMRMNGFQILTWREGRPSTAKLAEYARTFIESMKPGGCNSHLASFPGMVPRKLEVIHNDRSGRVAASWTAAPEPAFKVI